jgi:hypothetical protein
MAYEVERMLLNEDSALLVSCTNQSWIQARRLTRRWSKIRDRQMELTVEYLDTFASAANPTPTLFVTSPKASHEVYDGEWAHQSSGLVKEGDARTVDTVGIEQVLQEVFTISAIADLSALNRRRSHNDEREREFDFQDGRGDQITLDFPFLKPSTANETACMTTISEADFLTLAPAGYQFHQRLWSVDQETHTATLTLLFKAVVWNAWGHDAYADDYKEYSNAGTNNEEEVLTRTWVNIQNADVPAAVVDLRAGNRATSGYSLRSINVVNHRNGACDLVVREKVIKDGTDLLYGKEILRPFGWPECIGTREKIWVEYEGYATHALLLTASAGAETTPPTGYTFIGFDDTKDSDGFYGRRYDYEKVTWINHTPTAFRVVGEDNSDGNGLAQDKQACAVPQDKTTAAFAAITQDAGYVLSSKGISPQGNGEFSLHMRQTSVYAGTASSDALVVQVSQSSASASASGAIQRIWFRRTLEAKNTLVTATTGEARKNYLFEERTYSHRSFVVTDHNDGAYTVVQSLAIGAPNAYVNRKDRTDEYLIRREKVVIRISGGSESFEACIKSDYGKIYDEDDYASEQATSDAAWEWAKEAKSPHEHELVASGVFDDGTGIDMGTVQGTVIYQGGGRWLAVRTCYEALH